MTRNELTSSQTIREEEIQNHSLVFQPTSYQENAVNYELYSAPLGQTNIPNFIINSGSYAHTSGSIEIKKEIHLFDTEQSATKFVTEIGESNVSLVKEIAIEGRNWIEIHVIEHASLFFDFEISDFEEKEGYKIEVYRSSSLGLLNSNRSDANSYLKYFDVETDNG